MPPRTPLQSARAVLADDVLGVDELRRVFGPVDGLDNVALDSVPFDAEELQGAKARGEMLILRAPSSGGTPLTLLQLIQRFADAFDPGPLRKMGYQLKEDWGIELEPLAAKDTCRAGWFLVRKAVLPETCNLKYEEQDAHVARYPGSDTGTVRRRTAIEIAFDVIAFQRARGEHLLATTWDWSSSRTNDGGYLNLGRFAGQGMQIFSYSTAVRHGCLGVCPNRDPRS